MNDPVSAIVPQPIRIEVAEKAHVSGLLLVPADARACFVLAHGAGAGMEHPFMVATAQGLAARGIASLRYQFPYMEKGTRRPDAEFVGQATVRAAVAEASRRLPQVPLLAGGKSFGGRMTSQAQAAAPLDGVRGLVLIGFPLHPAGQPSIERAKHLEEVRVPMLFLQGTRDALADMESMKSVVATLGPRASLVELEGADHAFEVPARSGRKNADVMAEMVDAIAAWIASTTPGA